MFTKYPSSSGHRHTFDSCWKLALQPPVSQILISVAHRKQFCTAQGKQVWTSGTVFRWNPSLRGQVQMLELRTKFGLHPELSHVAISVRQERQFCTKHGRQVFGIGTISRWKPLFVGHVQTFMVLMKLGLQPLISHTAKLEAQSKQFGSWQGKQVVGVSRRNPYPSGH